MIAASWDAARGADAISAHYPHEVEGNQFRQTHRVARRALFEPLTAAGRIAPPTAAFTRITGDAGARAGISTVGRFSGAGIRSTGRGRGGGTRLQQLAGSHPALVSAARAHAAGGSGRSEGAGLAASPRPPQHPLAVAGASAARLRQHIPAVLGGGA